MKFSWVVNCTELNCGQIKTKKKNLQYICEVKKVTVRPALIRNDPVYPPGEWLRGHRVTQVRDRRPPSPRTAPLLSAYGTEEEGVTKARALGVIRKGLMSCFGPGSHPGWPLRKAIQGPGVDHNQESLQDGVFTHRYESDPLLSDIHNVLVCIYMW